MMIDLQTVYLNWKGPQGRETVDEFTRAPGQTFRQFNEYLAAMRREYALAGMSVYRSSRPCRGWSK